MKTFMRKFYFADLRSARIYVSASSFVWAAIFVSVEGLFQTPSWSFLEMYLSQALASLTLFVLSYAQLCLANSDVTGLSRKADSLIHTVYAGFWIFCAVSLFEVQAESHFLSVLIINHVILAVLGFWILSRGFWTVKV